MIVKPFKSFQEIEHPPGKKKMSASRMFALAGASAYRNCLRRHTTSAFIFSPEHPISLIKLVSSSSVYFPRYSSLAGVLEDDTTSPDATGDSVGTSLLNHQLWPEWVAFVDNLKSKGYFANSNGTDGGVLDDMNSLKTACLSFARDRFDIFKSLSKNEIQAVVDKGCPNLFRKAVNSAKRLRAHLQLNERDVCKGCVLHESCDRAFSELKDVEATARTTDIVRVLMSYALDPTITSGSGNKTQDREAVEVSARNLLTELTDLSETDRDDDLVDPDVAVYPQKKQSVSENADSDEIRKGDWLCPKCNYVNFARNKRCKKCGEGGPRRVDGNDRRVGRNDIEMKQGDWICPDCDFMNFAKNIRCLKCKTKGPDNNQIGERKPGDWDCIKCAFVNFANKPSCVRCGESREIKILGEWECPGCHYWNYSRNATCKKCDHNCPKQS